MSADKPTVVVTGGAGFVGSAICRRLVATGRYRIVNVDKLTYCASPEALGSIADSTDYAFVQADIVDGAAMLAILRREEADAIMHLAAETHVDRSIRAPAAFVETNVVGTFTLLEAATAHWRKLEGARRGGFRFLQVSTDEVFGDLAADDPPFTEESPYAPSSPYSASKAASDHLVRAWRNTYGLPVIVSNCSNNYGPFQYPDKLIPLVILNALAGKPLPVYGEGANVRDWLHVEDHARALELVLARGEVGETYMVGGRAERSNLAVVHAVCAALDRKRPAESGRSRRELIAFVADRPGHDRRYAVDPSKIERSLGWRAQESFESGLEATVDWYLGNEKWWRPIVERG